MKFDILSQQNLYKGFFRVDAYEFRHELFAGGWSGTVRREIFERRNAVAVLLHDPVADTLLVIEQFRPGAALRDAQGAWMVEIVAGIVEDGESNADVARREAQEEAGCTLDTLEHIIDFYPSAGGFTEIVSLYYAPVDLSAVPTGIHGLPEEHEDIRVSVIPRHTALAWLKAGKIQASLAIIALQWLALEKPPR
ncbi:NUDIX domain-containing protein [Thiothrix subterranea]|uniref:NUDIX domain-containing protein n=1 Tax=Thiothrix subterranea TaxID=2735563 RepID=UPI00280B246F|nr:NUDIX domain-containing protein [Thiothrix subterranea]